MDIHFEATEIGCEDDGYALVCGASNSKSESEYHYMIIQGCSDPDDEDNDGIHFSIDDQINGNYDLLDTCEVTRQQIIVTLHKDVPWYPGLRKVIVDCGSTPDSDFEPLLAGLRRLFWDRPADLIISE
jgi:hypothetical protein